MSGVLFSPRQLQLETKRRRQIPNEVLPERAPEALRAARDLWCGRFPNIVPRSHSATYNCVGLVVASRRVGVEPAHLIWVLQEDGYRRLGGPAEAERGDVVVYYNEGVDEPAHVGIILRKDLVLAGEGGEPLTVLSQWGRDGEYIHKLSEVPPIYGHPREFWTERRVV